MATSPRSGTHFGERNLFLSHIRRSNRIKWQSGIFRVTERYASSSDGSSSMMTPEFASMPATRRSVWYATEAARLQLEQRQWNAADTVQRAWRLHRPVVLYPRSRRLAIMVMRANPDRNGTFEEAWHRIAVFISGAVPM